MKHLRLPIMLSIAAAILTLSLKTVAWYVTGSVGLLSDAAESGVNLAAAVTAYLSILYAARPADRTHTYGHEKIEFFSSGLEGVLIAVAALAIVRTSVLRFVEPVPLTALGLGTAIGLVASAINLVVAQILLRVGRRHHSIVLEADGHHLMTDVWTSVAVLAGIALVWLTDQTWIDPVAGILMGIYILFVAFSLIRRSFNGLMDHALPEAELRALRETIASALEPGTTFHALRTRRGGTRRFADCHLLVPGSWSVAQGHELAERVERAAAAALPKLEITVHLEPIEADASWRDSEILHLERE